jgi:putative transposase
LIRQTLALNFNSSTHIRYTFPAVRQAFRFKLYQHKRTRHLDRTIDLAAGAWNHAVALHRCYYRLFGKTLPKAKLQSHLAKLRQTTRRKWLALNSQTLQQIADRLYLGWTAFFEGNAKRPPTFKKRRKYRSITFKQTGFKLIGRGRLLIGSRTYRFWQSQAIEGLIKTITISRNVLGELFVSFSCDEVWPSDPLPKTGQTAGIDRGLKDFATLQNGERLTAPQPFKHALREIRNLSRALSTKVKGSNGRKKARLALARAHERIANVRTEWHRQTARDLVRRFDILTIEDLTLKGMSKLWGRKVADLGLGDFAVTLEQQAAKTGKTLLKYPRFSRSTGVCPSCGAEHRLMLWQRSFDCCSTLWDRDQAAAMILNEAGRSLRPGAGVRPGDVSLRQPALVTAGSQLKDAGSVSATIPRALAVGVRQQEPPNQSRTRYVTMFFIMSALPNQIATQIEARIFRAGVSTPVTMQVINVEYNDDGRIIALDIGPAIATETVEILDGYTYFRQGEPVALSENELAEVAKRVVVANSTPEPAEALY